LRPKTIAEKCGKGRVRETVGSDSDNDELDEFEDGASSSLSSVIARKQHASDKHALMAAQPQDEQTLTKTIQASIDKQKR
jgi:hypothetical protein